MALSYEILLAGSRHYGLIWSLVVNNKSMQSACIVVESIVFRVSGVKLSSKTRWRVPVCNILVALDFHCLIST